jgi:Flp pilus assembly protein TadD
LVHTGRLDEAIAHYREALVLSPQYAEACNNLGEALAGKGAFPEAIAQFAKAVQLAPDYPSARTNLGTMLARTGQADKAVVHLRKVVEGSPDAADARRNLGHALAEKGDFQAARVQLEKADQLSGGQDPLTLHLLGKVYADLGRVSQAVRAEREALALAMARQMPDLMQAIGEHLQQMGEAGSPLARPRPPHEP